MHAHSCLHSSGRYRLLEFVSLPTGRGIDSNHRGESLRKSRAVRNVRCARGALRATLEECTTGTHPRDRSANSSEGVSARVFMTRPVTIAGTTMLDDTTSPVGRRSGLLGGSAPYAALAAARYCRVRVVSIVGIDAIEKVKIAFAGCDIDLSDLAVSPEPSYHEVTVHEDLDGRTTLVLSERNCFSEWNPSISPAAAASPICFVGSAPPDVQLRLLD